MDIELLKYPIGKFVPPEDITKADRDGYILNIQSFANEIRDGVAGLTNEQFDTPYRPGGWTIRQVVHHLADSHLNSYIRFKWTVTEQQPVIKSYDEKDWACLKDAEEAPVEISLKLLAALHERWVWFLRSLTENDWDKCFTHPETNKLIPLDLNLALYSWHGSHHLGHIKAKRHKEDW
jgi:hypothetical protein